MKLRLNPIEPSDMITIRHKKKYIQLQNNNNKTENWAEPELGNSGARQTHTLKKALKQLF